MDNDIRVRKVVAARLQEWMDSHIELFNQKRLGARAGIGQTTIGRILHCQVSCTVDVIQQLADAFGRDPGELLREGPAHGGIDYERDRYAALPSYEKARVEAFIKSVIAEHEYREAQQQTAKETAAADEASAPAKRVRRASPKPAKPEKPAKPATKRR